MLLIYPINNTIIMFYDISLPPPPWIVETWINPLYDVSPHMS